MKIERFDDRFPAATGEEPLLLTPQRFEDERGFFLEAWNRIRFAEALGLPPEQAPRFDQDNGSRSRRGVVRGLHYQLPPAAQGKLVRCLAGEIYDVIVDIRRGSPAFGRWLGVRLSAANLHQLWVPPGFAHGFLALSDGAEVLYKVSGRWNRACERSLLWNDPALGIDWPLGDLQGAAPILSAKDAAAPTLSEAVAADEVFP
jgi:dTDP-4-dehydrorhamnose 3,5-epimerase